MTILIVFKASLFMESSKAISVKISLTHQIIKEKAKMQAINNQKKEIIAKITDLINQIIKDRIRFKAAIRIKDLDNLKT